MPDTTDPAPPPPGWEGLLAPGERILWHGRPDGAIVWGDLARPDTFFGLAIVGIALLLIVKGPNDGAAVVGTVFLIGGIYMAIGRLWRDAWERRATYYTLTDRAAFVATDLFGRKRLARYPIDPSAKITLEDGQPGSVWFAVSEKQTPGRWIGSHSDGSYIPPQTSRRPVGFRRIDEARKVYALMAEHGRGELAGDGPSR